MRRPRNEILGECRSAQWAQDFGTLHNVLSPTRRQDRNLIEALKQGAVARLNPEGRESAKVGVQIQVCSAVGHCASAGAGRANDYRSSRSVEFGVMWDAPGSPCRAKLLSESAAQGSQVGSDPGYCRWEGVLVGAKTHQCADGAPLGLRDPP